MQKKRFNFEPMATDKVLIIYTYEKKEHINSYHSKKGAIPVLAGRTCLFLFFFFLLISSRTHGWSNPSQYLQQLEKTGVSDSIKHDAYYNLVRHYEYSNPDSARYYLHKGVNYFEQKNNKRYIAALWVLEANLDTKAGQLAASQKRLDISMALYQELGDSTGLPELFNLKGENAGRKGDFLEATKYFTTAVNIGKKQNDRKQVASAYLKMGVVCERNEDLIRALDYYNQSLKIYTQLGISNDIATLYNNIGIVYGKKDSLQKAISYFYKAIEVSRNRRTFNEAYVYAFQNLSIAYWQSGDKKNALASASEALRLAEEQRQPENIARMLYNMSEFYSEENPKKAIKLMESALSKANQLEPKQLKSEIIEVLSDLYGNTGDYKKAFELKKSHDLLDDSLFNSRARSEISNLQSIYEMEESQNKISELRLVKAKNELEKKLAYTVLIFLTCIIVGLTIMYFRMKTANRKLNEHEQELDAANKMKDKLFAVIGHDLKGPMGCMQSLLSLYENPASSPLQKEKLYEAMKTLTAASYHKLDELLLWGQAQIKGTICNMSEFSPLKYIKSNLELKASESQLKGINITVHVPENMFIYADPTHFDFVIRNLIANAIKFTNKNGMVKINLFQETLPGFYVFEVSDNGIGMSEQSAKGIFGPNNISKAGTGNEKGTSIGLMLCKYFIELNGGKIWVETAPDKGANFFFSVPNRAAPAA